MSISAYDDALVTAQQLIRDEMHILAAKVSKGNPAEIKELDPLNSFSAAKLLIDSNDLYRKLPEEIKLEHGVSHCAISCGTSGSKGIITLIVQH